MREQCQFEKRSFKKGQKLLTCMAVLICCNLLIVVFAATMGYSFPSSKQIVSEGKSVASASLAMTVEERQAARQKQREERIMRAQQAGGEEKQITLNEEQRKKLALLLLFAGGKAKNIHL